MNLTELSISEFGAVSYAIVGALYVVFSLLLLTSWRGKFVGAYLIAAAAISAVWSTALAVQAVTDVVPMSVTMVLEALRGGAWLTFLLVLLAQLDVSRWLRLGVHAVWMAFLVAAIVWWSQRAQFGLAVGVSYVLIPGGLMVALSGLVLIEQLYRNSAADARWGLRALALGLGGLFAYDLFLFSQGMLFGVLDTTSWMARGAANILFVPLIAIAARRNPDWDLNIFVSRQVVFYTTSLIAVGIYLVVMSLGGYALVIYGGTWGELAQIVFFAGAILVLVALLFSNRIRARVKVFLSKHFFHNKYDYREEWLRLIASLTVLEDSSIRQIVIKSMAQIVDSPGGVLWTIDDAGRNYQHTSSYESVSAAPAIPATSSLVSFIKRDGWLIDLEEFKRRPDLYDGLTMPEWFGGMEEAWLIVPLMYRKELLGMIMLHRAPGTPPLNYEDRDLLKTVGNHLAVHVAQERSDVLLAEAQQFEAYNRLTAFLMHDLNNLIAQQSLIIRNAEKHKRNPDFVDDAIHTISGSVDRMTRVMNQLKRGEADRLARRTELRFIISAAVDRCDNKTPGPSVDLDGLDASLSVDAEEFTMVLVHLIQNAQDATGEEGAVSVTAAAADGSVRISISDTGSGMTPEFVRDQLFKPFTSTKGSQGMGIGAYQAREFARKMGGELRVDSEPGRGTTMTLTLPLPA